MPTSLNFAIFCLELTEPSTKMKAFRWRSLVTLIVAIGVLISAWLSLGQTSDVGSADAGRAVGEVAARLMGLAAALLLLLGLLSLVMRKAWLAGLRLLIGIWLLASPWIPSHGTEPVPMLVVIAGGIAIVAVAAFDLYRDFLHESDALSHMS
jgi:peptidoglycan/LPS O-acetylase OafA/YrhL